MEVPFLDPGFLPPTHEKHHLPCPRDTKWYPRARWKPCDTHPPHSLRCGWRWRPRFSCRWLQPVPSRMPLWMRTTATKRSMNRGSTPRPRLSTSAPWRSSNPDRQVRLGDLFVDGAPPIGVDFAYQVDVPKGFGHRRPLPLMLGGRRSLRRTRARPSSRFR